MKSTIKTGLAAILLLVAFSCTKENTNSSANSDNRPAVAISSQSSDLLAQSLDEQSDLQVAGKWILYYDWYCTGYYGSSVVTVNADGTWSDDQGDVGLWASGRHIFMFNFSNYETIYSGVICSKQIRGIMNTFQYAQSPQGCFYMVPDTDLNFRGERKAGALGANGQQQK